MKVLVTGSAGHLGEALMRSLPEQGMMAVGFDQRPSAFTDYVGSVTDPGIVRAALAGVDAVIHTATLHKPHVATHCRQTFVNTNVSGTLTLLDACHDMGIRRFVFTSTTSAFGDALSPPSGAPAAWIDESVPSVPKNIYGVTKTAAEDLCRLFARRFGLAVIVLRTSRFFPEADDAAAIRSSYSDQNAKANEFAFRRLDLEDAVTGHIAALHNAERIGWGRYILSAVTPFTRGDCVALSADANAVLAQHVPEMSAIYAGLDYRMFPQLDRVYDSSAARSDLGWAPKWDFASVLSQLAEGGPIGSELARRVGAKGYHDEVFEDGPYPVAP